MAALPEHVRAISVFRLMMTEIKVNLLWPYSYTSIVENKPHHPCT